MAVYSQSQTMRFLMQPRPAGPSIVKSYNWINLCTINLQLPTNARLIKLSGYVTELQDQFDVTTPKQYSEVNKYTWKMSGRWYGPKLSVIPINRCDFNCPLSFAALSVKTQENWFLTSDQPWYLRECFFMGGYSVEELTIEFTDQVDITGVPNPPFADRYLAFDTVLSVEYEL